MLCEVLEPILSVRDKEDIAKSLVHIMQKMGRSKDFLADVVMGEIARLGEFSHQKYYKVHKISS